MSGARYVVARDWLFDDYERWGIYDTERQEFAGFGPFHSAVAEAVADINDDELIRPTYIWEPMDQRAGEAARIRAFGLDVAPTPASGWPIGDPAIHTTHGACGRWWRQRGNKTGHCGACHETFEGQGVFDAHQSQGPDGRAICADPALVLYRGELLRLVDGSWRGPGMPEGVTFGGSAA